MNNILFAILPFLLFGFILEILLKGRFSRRLNFIVYNVVFAAVAITHLAVGFTAFDNALLLSWMPVSAYLPMVITLFILSARNAVKCFTGEYENNIKEVTSPNGDVVRIPVYTTDHASLRGSWAMFSSDGCCGFCRYLMFKGASGYCGKSGK